MMREQPDKFRTSAVEVAEFPGFEFPGVTIQTRWFQLEYLHDDQPPT